MNIKWLGHSCFVITSSEGVKVITDPYQLGLGAIFMRMSYDEVNEEADIVLLSHNHPDHNNVKAVRGNPEVIREVGTREVKGIPIKGVASRHGTFRSLNVIFCFTVDEVKLCHLGDIGYLLDASQLAEIGDVDVLFAPAGGFPVMRPEGVAEVCHQIKPRVVIPMHYKNDKCRFFIFADPNRFFNQFPADAVEHLEGREIEVSKGQLPMETTVKVFAV